MSEVGEEERGPDHYEVITDPAYVAPQLSRTSHKLPFPLHPLRVGGPDHKNETSSSLTPHGP